MDAERGIGVTGRHGEGPGVGRPGHRRHPEGAPGFEHRIPAQRETAVRLAEARGNHRVASGLQPRPHDAIRLRPDYGVRVGARQVGEALGSSVALPRGRRSEQVQVGIERIAPGRVAVRLEYHAEGARHRSQVVAVFAARPARDLAGIEPNRVDLAGSVGGLGIEPEKIAARREPRTRAALEQNLALLGLGSTLGRRSRGNFCVDIQDQRGATLIELRGAFPLIRSEMRDGAGQQDANDQMTASSGELSRGSTRHRLRERCVNRGGGHHAERHRRQQRFRAEAAQKRDQRAYSHQPGTSGHSEMVLAPGVPLADEIDR